MKKLFIFFLALFIGESINGQIYPVSVNLQLNSALGPTLNHLSNPGQDQLNLILNLNDNSVSSLEVFLEFEISTTYFTIKSNYLAINHAITLTSGEVNFLSNSDLLNYFAPSAWTYSGNYSAFLYTQALIEGEYEICVRVIDANHPNHLQVSNQFCLSTYYTYSDPPQLNFPFCGTILNADLNQLFFQWNSIPDFESRSRLSYKLEIWELLFDENNYNQVVASTAPIFTFTTENSFYNYLLNDPILVQGRKYIWRVQVTDENEFILFRNNGNSEICSFTYGESDLFNQLFEIELNIQSGNSFSAIAHWNDVSIANHYQLSYKKIGTESWFSNFSSENNCMIYNLEASTTYQGRVRYIINSDTSDWSNLKIFNTPNQNTVNCNNQDYYNVPGEFDPLQLAVPGMNITIGQFVLQLTEVQPLFSTGRFKGRGNILVYNSIPIAVEFSNIFIDQSLQVRDGTVKAISNGLGFWTSENTVGTLDNGNENAETDLDFEVDTIIITDGIISILGPNNEEVTIELDSSFGNTIEDSNGDLFVVTNTGEVLFVGNSGSGIGSIDPALNYLDYEVGKGEFSSSIDQIYGYDHFVNGELQTFYKTIRIINTNSEKICDWKSVQTSKYDIINFNLLDLGANYSSDSLIFVSGTGTVYYPKKNNANYEISFIGGQHGDVQELFAGIKTENGIKFIDKIFLVNYNLQIKKLHIINFGPNQLPSKTVIESGLSKIYLSSLINWEVQISTEIELPESWDLNGDGSLEINSDLLSRYSDELKIWNQNLKNKNYYYNETYYIIIPGVAASNTAVIAEMPRGKNIGYLFTNDIDISTSIAHELAHGAFGLLHIFSGNSGLPQGSTSNLLDYPAGLKLYKYQWDLIQDPAALTGLTDSDDEQFLYTNSFVGPSINLMNKNASYLTPTGKAITIPNITHGRFNVFGGLIWFKLTSGAEYGAVLNRNDDFFYGYVAKNDISKVEGVLTDEKIGVLNNLLFSEFEYTEIDAPVYANARLDLGDMLVVCVCDYSWSNNSKSSSIAEISSNKLIPANAEKENCLGQHCINPNGAGIKSGAGRMLFIYNASFLTDGKNFSDFVDLCNWLTDTIQNNKFAFYGYDSEDFRGGDVFTQDHAKIFREQDIFSKTDLFQKFSFLISTTDYPFVFSTKNLWEGVPIGYNRNSIDHILYNSGIVKNYEYTFVDLVTRESLKLNPWFVAIENLESEGKCKPLSQSNYFQQYLAEFGTNSAFPYLANCSSKWARDILISYLGNLAAPTIGSSITLLSDMAGPALSSLVNSSSLAALTSEIETIFFLYSFRKLTIDAFIGAAIDFLIHVAIEYYFLGDENTTFNECISKVDYYEVGASALENGFCNLFNNKYNILISSGVSCLYDGFTEDGRLIEGFDYNDCSKGILTALLSNKISHYAVDKLKKISFDKFKIGIKKLGNFTDEKIEEIATWVGVKDGFFIGDFIAGKKIRNIRPGTIQKTAVIGRKMDGHVNEVVLTLEDQGIDVESFSEFYQKNNIFTIDGINYSWQQIKDDFSNPINPSTGIRKYKSINNLGWIDDEDIPNTLMFKANEQWARKLVNQGYCVIDIGYPEGLNLEQSLFYNMELLIIF